MRDVTLEDGTKIPVKSLKYATIRDLEKRKLTPRTISKNDDPADASDEAVRIVLSEVIGENKTNDLIENGLNSDVSKLFSGIWAESYGVPEEEKNS